MPALLILPIFGIAAIVILVAHATHKSSAPGERAKSPGAGSRQFELDRGMPEDVVQQVLTALVQDSDPAQLEALALQLTRKYPLAASELRAKGAELRAVATPGTAPSRRSAAARPTGISSPDLSEAALVLQAAMKAYAEETDPVALEGFADSIRAKFPTGAILLLGRARELQAEHPPATGAPAAAGGVAGAGAPPALPAAPPRVATYVVQPGDTPTLIAQRLTRDGARWPELAAANPSKALARDGTFASLRPGEALNLPASWSTPAVSVAHVANHTEGQS